MFKIFKYKNYQPRTVYAAKLSFKYEGERNLSPKREAEGFSNIRTALQEIWNRARQAEIKNMKSPKSSD